jgi:hypothetical protein
VALLSYINDGTLLRIQIVKESNGGGAIRWFEHVH